MLNIFQGDRSPAGTHPSRLKKEGAVSVNFNQRIPRESVDIIQSTIEYRLVVEAFTDFFSFIHDLVRCRDLQTHFYTNMYFNIGGNSSARRLQTSIPLR
jgi:hypothetical protein